jgi:hypothetical protein
MVMVLVLVLILVLVLVPWSHHTDCRLPTAPPAPAGEPRPSHAAARVNKVARGSGARLSVKVIPIYIIYITMFSVVSGSGPDAWMIGLPEPRLPVLVP